jgi:hypothetical protein
MTSYVSDVIQFYGAFWYAEHMQLDLDSKTNEFILTSFNVQDGYYPAYKKVTGTFVDKSDVIVLTNQKRNNIGYPDKLSEPILYTMTDQIMELQEEDYKKVKDLLANAVQKLKILPSKLENSKKVDLFYKVDEKSLRIPTDYEFIFDRIFLE